MNGVGSVLAAPAKVGASTAPGDTDDGFAAGETVLFGAGVHTMVVLVGARHPEQVDILFVGQAAAPSDDRCLQNALHGVV